MSRSRRSSGMGLWFVFASCVAGAALVPQACAPEVVQKNTLLCPNGYPVNGASCPTPGLACSYGHPAGCPGHFLATCGEDSAWHFVDDCISTGGAGGSVPTGGSGGGGSGGSGGELCTDPVAGAPSVTSALAVTYPPDGKSYALAFSEEVSNIGPSLTWNGTGSITSVKQTGAQTFTVEWTGMTPGTHSTLTVGTGAVDKCGTPLAAPVDIDVALLASCHLLAQSFEGDFSADGWSVTDAAGAGALWARNDFLAGGVTNHTDGAGLCASAGGHGLPPTIAWNGALVSPTIDLAGTNHAVLRYEGAFARTPGSGNARLEASSDGTNWSGLTAFTANRGPGQETVDVSAFAGGDLQLRWRYDDPAGTSSYWDVDDVCVESFTGQSCPCPANSRNELNDVLGTTDGNGLFTTAEDTLSTLVLAGDRVAVCGQLEDASKSGPDYFKFNLGGVAATDRYLVKVTYCLESHFQDADVALWVKTKPEPLAVVHGARDSGEFTTTLNGGGQYYLTLTPTGLPYGTARYSASVTVQKKLGPILTEGFEFWPPDNLNITDDDTCLDWSQSLGTVVPTGGLPTEGLYLAVFNSYDCSTGSESLETPTLNFSGKSAAALTFDMYHDPGYPDAFDTIQVQYNIGGLWIDAGPAFTRPAAVAGWTTQTVDLSAVANRPSVKIRLTATTQYGNDTHIDNVVLLGG